jgi:hypothetical protein
MITTTWRIAMPSITVPIARRFIVHEPQMYPGARTAHKTDIGERCSLPEPGLDVAASQNVHDWDKRQRRLLKDRHTDAAEHIQTITTAV